MLFLKKLSGSYEFSPVPNFAFLSDACTVKLINQHELEYFRVAILVS